MVGFPRGVYFRGRGRSTGAGGRPREDRRPGLFEIMKYFNQITHGRPGLPGRGKVGEILAEDAAGCGPLDGSQHLGCPAVSLAPVCLPPAPVTGVAPA
jgi:hypothetical protein